MNLMEIVKSPKALLSCHALYEVEERKKNTKSDINKKKINGKNYDMIVNVCF